MRGAVAAAGLLLGGCGSSDPIVPPGPVGPLEITDRASGQTLRLVAGQELHLTLSECGRCGRQWMVTERPAVLTELARADLGSDTPETSGGNAKIQYLFHADRAGAGRLVVKNIFPPRVTDGPTLSFTVEVR